MLIYLCRYDTTYTPERITAAETHLLHFIGDYTISHILYSVKVKYQILTFYFFVLNVSQYSLKEKNLSLFLFFLYV